MKISTLSLSLSLYVVRLLVKPSRAGRGDLASSAFNSAVMVVVVVVVVLTK